MDDGKHTTIFPGVSRQLRSYFVSGGRRRGEGRILLKILTYCVAKHQEEGRVFCVGFVTWQDPL